MRQPIFKIAATLATCLCATILALCVMAPNNPSTSPMASTSEFQSQTAQPTATTNGDAPDSNALATDRPDSSHGTQQVDATDGEQSAGGKPYAFSVVCDDPAFGGADYVANETLVKLSAGMASEDVTAVIVAEQPALNGMSVLETVGDYVRLSLPETLSVPDALNLLKQSSIIEAAQPNFVYTSQITEPDLQLTAQSFLAGQADTAADRTWGLESIYAPEAWEKVKSDAPQSGQDSVCIAVIDLGFYPHQDLFTAGATDGNVLAKWRPSGTENENPPIDNNADFYPSTEMYYLYNATSGEQRDSTLTIIGHGTHVAGVLGAMAGNSQGIDGVSYNAKLALVNVGDVGHNAETGTSSIEANTVMILNAYNQIIANRRSMNIRVINMSLGAPMETLPDKDENNDGVIDDALYQCINDALDVGIVTVCSAGNEGTTIKNYPSDFDNVVSVMGLKRKSVAGVLDPHTVARDTAYSNYNDATEPGDKWAGKNICAPGTEIFSTFVDDAYFESAYPAGHAFIPGSTSSKYDYLSGTSQAAAFVSGTLALVFTAHPTLTAQAAVQRVFGTATDLGAENWDADTGWGEVDAYAAVCGGRIEGADAVLLESAMPSDYANNYVAQSRLADSWTWSVEGANPNITVDSKGNVSGTACGSATLKAVSNTSDAITLDKNLTVSKVDLSKLKAMGYSLKVDYLNTPTYDGTPKAPQLLVYIPPKNASASAGSAPTGSRILVEGVDYKATFSNNTRAGSNAKVTIQRLGDSYEGTYLNTFSFSINPAALSSSDVALSVDRVDYTGSELMPAVTVTHGGRLLTKGTDYSVTYFNNVAPGSGKVIVSGMNNYSGSVTKYFSIIGSGSGATGSKGTKAQSLSISKITKKVKYSKLKKKTQKVACPVVVDNAHGTVSYELVSVNKKAAKKKIKMNSSTGKVTVKKGLKKGKYKLTIKVTASGDASYAPAEATVIAALRVK